MRLSVSGAYYYYHTEKNKTYEQTILDVKVYADMLKLPYRYVLFSHSVCLYLYLAIAHARSLILITYCAVRWLSLADVCSTEECLGA